MEIVLHTMASQFLEANKVLLYESEAENNLLIGLAIKLEKEPHLFGKLPPIFITVTDGGQSIFCSLQTPPMGVLLYGKPELLDKSVSLLVDYYNGENLDIPSAFGPNKVSLRFAERWSSEKNLSIEKSMQMRVFKLESLNRKPYLKGYCREANDEDVELISDWVFKFHVRIKEPISKVDAQQKAVRKVKEKAIFLWEDEIPRCMTGIDRPSKNGITINYVYTPEEYRQRGYATSCVTFVSEMMLKKYRFCSLFTDASNPTSNKIYESIGYVHMDDMLKCEFF